MNALVTNLLLACSAMDADPSRSMATSLVDRDRHRPIGEPLVAAARTGDVLALAMADGAAIAATTLAAIAALPQLRRVVGGDGRGVSLSGALLGVVNELVWVVYAVHQGLWSAAPEAVLMTASNACRRLRATWRRATGAVRDGRRAAARAVAAAVTSAVGIASAVACRSPRPVTLVAPRRRASCCERYRPGRVRSVADHQRCTMVTPMRATLSAGPRGRGGPRVWWRRRAVDDDRLPRRRRRAAATTAATADERAPSADGQRPRPTAKAAPPPSPPRSRRRRRHDGGDDDDRRHATTGPHQAEPVRSRCSRPRRSPKAFNDLGAAFTAANPDAKANFVFAGSNDLATTVNEGGPADVFASADQNNMKKVTDAAGNGRRADDLRHQPARDHGRSPATRRASPASPTWPTPTSPSSRAHPRCPCGTYAQQIFTAAGVTVTPKSLEENVGGVVTKMKAGEGDAGIVYATDVLAAGDTAAGVEIPADINVIAQYPIVATVKQTTNPATAQAFIDFVLSDAGQQILASRTASPAP